MSATHSPSKSLALRLVAAAAISLAVALASIATSLWVTWQLEGGAAAVNEAGRLRMMTYRIAFDASQGGDNRERLAAAFDRTLALLHDGDPSRPLFLPASEEPRDELERVRATWTGFRASLATGGAVDAVQARELVAAIDRLVGAIERRLSYWTAVLRTFQLTMAGLAVVGALLLLYTSHVLVLEPLRKLGVAIGALRAGDLGARVAVPSTAEFGELADGFNSMARTMEAHYATLEDTVRRRTADLKAQHERMAALYEVSAFIAQAETLDEMSRGFVKMVRRIARADAAALRWSDAGHQRYLLLAQDGLPPAIAASEQCLPAGDCHCGQPQAVGGSRVIPIRRDGPGFNHCSRAGFQTLVTVPLALQHRVRGELDLFYCTPSDVTELDRSLLDLLASHMAGGMEGLRAAAAEKEAAVSSERTLIAQELHDSIAQSLAFLNIQVQLLRTAHARGDVKRLETAIDEIDAGVQESYGDVRELLMHFRTRADAEDIEPALRTTLRKFQLQTGLETHVEFIGHGVPLPNDVQVQVLHIVQEALSNVRKHAGASRVSVRVEQAPAWRFTVSDDGAGFDPQADHAEDHVGLRIMAERAERIAAELRLSSAPGEGTTVTLLLAPIAMSETEAAA